MAGSTTPALRWTRISFRSAHIISFSGLVGGHLFDTPADSLRPWLYAAIASGATLIATYLYQSLRWLREIRGVAIMLKATLLCVIPFWWQARVPILIAIIILSSYVSHMPGRYRYWLVGKGRPDD